MPYRSHDIRLLGGLLFAAAVVAFWPSAGYAEGPEVETDAAGDAVARPTDAGLQLPFDPQANPLIDLLEVSLGAWAPSDAAADLFDGIYDRDGAFVRIDLVLAGLVNPPGPNSPSAFAPFLFGDHPVYGFVEFDLDDDVSTGGELFAPQFRYLGNVARFGGLPDSSDLHERAALDASAFDGDVRTPPLVERSGEEFHLALLGELFANATIEKLQGDPDDLFESGETWRAHGAFFHRAHGFEPFSFAAGGETPGEYTPPGVLEFSHNPAADTTRVSLVFPLTNGGAALARGELQEQNDGDPSNQASVLEGLVDLKTSAQFFEMFPTGLAEEELILGWASRTPTDHLEPKDWEVTVLLGTTYTEPAPDGVYFVWSDILPNVLRGDTDGSGILEPHDSESISEFIANADLDDGTADGRVTILDFASDFSVFDLNYDGVVDQTDVVLALACQPGAPGACDDGVACTVDECVGSGQCIHSPDHAACGDVDPCTADRCESAGCTWSPIPDCGVCIVPVGAQPDRIQDGQGALVPSAKNRFLSFQGGNPGRPQAVRITFVSLPPPFDVWNGLQMYVGPPAPASELPGKGMLDPPSSPSGGFTAATLQCAPFFTDWSAVGMVHVWHEGIVPSRLQPGGGVITALAWYDVQLIDQACTPSQEPNYSPPLGLTTSGWGDVAELVNGEFRGPDRRVSVDDALAVVLKFGGSLGAPSKSRAELLGSSPTGQSPVIDGKITVTDLIAVVNAFTGADYPFGASVSGFCP